MLDSHVELEMKRLVEEDGLSFKDARLKALRSFGNVTAARERFYESRRLIWVEDLKRRPPTCALRSLWKTPGFAAVAVLTLGLGIGANTAIASASCTGCLLKPLPYQDARRVVRARDEHAGGRISQQTTAAGIDGAHGGRDARGATGKPDALGRRDRDNHDPGVARDEESARLLGSRISASLFDMLAVRPAIGRAFEVAMKSSEPKNHPAQPRRLAAYLGGVLRPSAASSRGRRPSSARPSRYSVSASCRADFSTRSRISVLGSVPGYERSRRSATRNVVGATAAGCVIEAASAEINGLLRQMRPKSPGTTYELARERDELTADVKPALFVLTVAVGLVLLIACVNVANLLLARASAASTGARRSHGDRCGAGQTGRQMLTESALLAVFGAVLGSRWRSAGYACSKRSRKHQRIDFIVRLSVPRASKRSV